MEPSNLVKGNEYLFTHSEGEEIVIYDRKSRGKNHVFFKQVNKRCKSTYLLDTDTILNCISEPLKTAV